MKERLKTGAETFVEDQKLLYTVMYLGLRRAIGTLRRPEVPAKVYEFEPINQTGHTEDMDTTLPAAA